MKVYEDAAAFMANPPGLGMAAARFQGVTAGLHNPEEEWVHSSRARRSLHQS